MAVVAETQAQASDAAELIEVNYELLPVVTADNARQDGAPLVWEHVKGNIGFRWTGGTPRLSRLH